MTSRKYLLVTVVIISSLVLFSAPARATVYYVSKTGNDSSPCTQAQPCLTIQHGVNVAAGAGNILYIGAGTYTEDPTISTGGSGSAAMFTVQGFAPGNSCPTVATSDPSGVTFGFPTHPTPAVLVIGHFTLSANYVSLQCFEMEPNPPEYSQEEGHNSSFAGDAIYSTGTDNDVENNYIHKNPSYSGSIDTFGLGCAISGTSYIQANNCGGYAYNKAITMKGTGWTAKGNYMRHAAAQQTLLNCSTAHTCLFQDNEEYGGEDEIIAGTQSNNNHYDMDYNENLNGVDLEHDYMHGMDQNFCNAVNTGGQGACHIDCLEANGFGSANTIVNRIVCFNQNEGAYFGDSGTTYGVYNIMTNETITDSIFAFGPGNDGFNICGGFYHSGNVVWENNTCWGSWFGAFQGTQITSFQNNIMYQNTGYFTQPYLADSTSQFVTHRHNILLPSPGYTISLSFYANDLKNVDPLFVAPGAYDNTDTVAHNLHLQSTSLAIGAGATGLGVTLDFGLVTRPSPPAIGPYEFGAGTNSGLTPPTNLRVTVN